MKLLAIHAFNCIVFMVNFGQTSCEDIPPALMKHSLWVRVLELNLEAVKPHYRVCPWHFNSDPKKSSAAY